MRRTRFDEAPCPVARATDLIGDWWTPIILRDAMFGRTRFEDFQEALGVPRAILARRLARLVDEGLMEKVPYAARPPRHEYRLTDKGRAFFDVLAAMWRWGEDWLFADGARPPVMLADRETRKEVRPVVVDANTGEPIRAERVRVVRRR
jgi:DNA-binding HxlR family transcriptional regulator